MKVFKFGGASVKDAIGIKNVANIISGHKNNNLIVVVSAMGKVTNLLEELTKAYYYKTSNAKDVLEKIKQYHLQIIDELFEGENHIIYQEINSIFKIINEKVENQVSSPFDSQYDQLVSLGEFLSSKILSAYLNLTGYKNEWIDARDFLKTDSTFREAKINWELSQKLWDEKYKPLLEKGQNTYVTQGFIGSNAENLTTTLGRDGSDYSAAIISHIANAKDLTIWKDVPGLLNADPKWFDETEIISQISYHDAIELAYYGANIIHPKTIKPLQNKSIPLFVKSFINPETPGTVIDQNTSKLPVACFIFKVNQVLISISPKDFSFIIEENLSHIFKIFADYRVKIHVMNNTALKFSVCIDFDAQKNTDLVNKLSETFKVNVKNGLELVTIRYYDQKTIDRVTENKQIFLELKSRNTVQMVMSDVVKQSK